MERRKFLTGAAAGGVVAGAGLLASCGKEEAPKPAAETAPAPAISKSSKEMVIVSTWPRDFPGLGTSAQALAKRITDVTEGRITARYFAAGERVGAFDVFDAVASGNSQAYIGADYYWKGKHPAWAFFTSVPFGLTYAEMSAWIFHLGGQTLWDELADGFGLKCLPAGNTGVQMGGWFRKEINTASDLKGLKMRIPGLGGDVMSKVGASPVSLPGGQIYENLVSGALDATEWVGPYNDYFLKFYEAAKYYYWPGMHEPGGFISFGVNKSWWSKLSKTDQLIIQALTTQEAELMMSEANALNATYLEKLVKEHGVQLREFSDEIYDSFGKAAQAVFEETRAHSPLANKVYQSFLAARKSVGGWMKISDIAYSVKRNRVLRI